MKNGVTFIAGIVVTVVAHTLLAQTSGTLPEPSPTTKPASRPNATSGVEIKYVRDSAEYWALATYTFRAAWAEVEGRRSQLSAEDVWCVVVDVDETILDNSTYELERLAYGIPTGSAAWNEWVERRQAVTVPGAARFLQLVHAAEGRVAFITNRDQQAFKATQDNLAKVGVWGEYDLLCLMTKDETYDKKARRLEVAKGEGACSWPKVKAKVLVFVGDQLGDFPESGEAVAGDRVENLGKTYFLLPNPMYGGWLNKVTRPLD